MNNTEKTSGISFTKRKLADPPLRASESKLRELSEKKYRELVEI